MLAWVGGAAGAVVEIDTASDSVRPAQAGPRGWVRALAYIAGRLYGLADDALWVWEIRPSAGPRLERHLDLRHLEPASLGAARSGGRALLALAMGHGVLFLDPTSLAAVQTLSQPAGAQLVRPCGDGAVVVADNGGLVGRYELGTATLAPYFAPPGLGGMTLRGLDVDAHGALCLSTSAGYLVAYDEPGAPRLVERLSPEPLGATALDARWYFACRAAEVLAMGRDAGGQARLASPTSSSPAALLVAGETLLVVDRDGCLTSFALSLLRVGETLGPSAECDSGVRQAFSIASEAPRDGL
jgi:hypothetical protein